MRTKLIICATLGVLVLGSGSVLARDFDIVVDAAGHVTYVGGASVLVVAVENTPDNSSSWRIDNPSGAVRGSITFEGFWNVTDPRQALPKINGTYFTEFYGQEMDGAREDVNFVNVTGTDARQVFTFSLAPRGQAPAPLLTFQKDLVPPEFTVGTLENITHFSFLVVTRTDEPAFADLQIRPVSGGEPVPNPTPQPARRQNFPVQGLKPNTTYEFWIDFWDFSHNYARTPVMFMNTTAKPVFPPPVLLDFFPADNSMHTTPPPRVTIRATSPNVALRNGDVRIFVDRNEVTPTVTFDGETATYVPESPFPPGNHPVAAEITDAVGGFLLVKWKFTVTDAPTPGFEALAFLVAVVCAGRFASSPTDRFRGLQDPRRIH